MLGQIAGGIAKGIRSNRDREDQKEMNALRKQMINLQITNAKTKQQQDAFKQKLIDRFIQKMDQQQQTSESTSTPKDEGADKSKLVESMAMSPEEMAVFKSITDIDTLGAGRMGEQMRHNKQLESASDRNYKLRLDQFKREGEQFVPIVQKGPGGVETTTFRPKFGKPPTLTTQTKKSKGSESAGKVATVKAALQNFPYLKKSYIGEGGKVNRDIVLKSNAPFGGIGEGRKVRAQYLEALDAKIRAMTGAAINEQEIPYYDQQFFPSVLDNDATIKDKLFRMERFLNGYIEEMAPGENVDPKNMVTTPQGKQFKIKKIKTIKNRQEYDELPMGAVYKWNGIEYTKGK